MVENLSLFFSGSGEPALLDGRPVQGMTGMSADVPELAGMHIVAASLFYLLPATDVRTTDVQKLIVIQAGYHPGSYVVRRIEPDSSGLKRLLLEKAP